MTSSVTTKGQTTVPKEIRKYLKLEPGAKIKWFMLPDGGVVIKPTVPITALRGIIKYAGPPVSLEDMDPGSFDILRPSPEMAKNE